MEFENKVPVWKATGKEPSTDIQNNGFKAGYKPPATYFNYLFNAFVNCLNELQNSASDMHGALGVERARIDSFTSLKNGSTTADAELTDIRVGADGVTYGNAGTSVRTQFANVKKDIAAIIAENLAQTDKIRGFAPAITNTVSGKALYMADCAEMPLQEFKVFGKSKQEDTPSPSSPADITSIGENGSISVGIYKKNLLENVFEPTTKNGVTTTLNADGSITFNGTATEVFGMAVNAAAYLPNGKYKVIGGSKNLSLAIWGMTADGWKSLVYDYGEGGAFEADDNLYRYYLAQYTVKTNIAYNETVYPMITLAENTDNTYEQHEEPQTLVLSTPNGLRGLPVTSGGNYTDENGQQWICDEIDLERGVFVKRIEKIEFDGSEPWNDGVFSTDASLTYVYLLGGVMQNVAQSWCTHAKFSLDTAHWSNGEYMRSGGGLWQTMTSMAVEEWSAYLAEQAANGTPVTVYYPINEPIETALTEEEIAAYKALHTNKLITSVLSLVDMQLEYVQDEETYIRDLVDYYLKEQVNEAVNKYIEQESGMYLTKKDKEELINMIKNSGTGTNNSNARIGEVELTASGWIGNASLYSQIVSIDGITANSQVDLTPSVEQLAAFYEKDLTLVTENKNGIVTVYAIGQKPKNDYTIQVTITEVAYE